MKLYSLMDIDHTCMYNCILNIVIYVINVLLYI